MPTIDESDPRCPECGEPIGQTAVYCMHCSADLTDERESHDADDDGAWDSAEAGSSVSESGSSGDAGSRTESGSSADSESVPTRPVNTGSSESTDRQVIDTEGQLLDPDGLVDDTLTVVVGIVGGIVVGFVGTMELLFLTGSGWAILFGFVAWLGATAYLVRRRTVQGAVSASGYATAAALLVAPLIAFSPFVTVDGGIGERGGLFLVLFFFVGAPALVVLGIGWIAGRFVPEGTDDGSGS